MKAKTILLSSCFALALGAATLGVAAMQPNEQAIIEAPTKHNLEDPLHKGTISIDLTGENWATNPTGQHISVLFSDGTNEAWGSYEFIAENTFAAFIDYELDFTPTTMTAYRYSNWWTKDKWEDDPKCTGDDNGWGKWNTAQVDFVENGNIIIAGTSFVGYPYMSGKRAESNWNWTENYATLSGVKLNGSNHIEYYIIKEFSQWEEFGIKISDWADWWNTPTLSSHVAEGAFIKNGSNNAQCTIAGTYALFLDRNSGSIFINDPSYVEADDFGQQFLLGMQCDGQGTITKDSWSSLAAAYALLDAETKALFEEGDGDENGSEYYIKALARYDYIVGKYGKETYSDFMGRIEKGKLTLSPASYFAQSNNVNGAALAILGICGLAAVTGAGFFFLRRKER